MEKKKGLPEGTIKIVEKLLKLTIIKQLPSTWNCPSQKWHTRKKIPRKGYFSRKDQNKWQRKSCFQLCFSCLCYEKSKQFNFHNCTCRAERGAMLGRRGGRSSSPRVPVGYLLMTSKEGELSRICPMLLFSKSGSAPVNASQEQKASS